MSYRIVPAKCGNCGRAVELDDRCECADCICGTYRMGGNRVPIRSCPVHASS